MAPSYRMNAAALTQLRLCRHSLNDLLERNYDVKTRIQRWFMNGLLESVNQISNLLRQFGNFRHMRSLQKRSLVLYQTRQDFCLNFAHLRPC